MRTKLNSSQALTLKYLHILRLKQRWMNWLIGKGTNKIHIFLCCFCYNVTIIYRFVVLGFNGMKIRDDLVFDKETDEITGFVDY